MKVNNRMIAQVVHDVVMDLLNCRETLGKKFYKKGIYGGDVVFDELSMDEDLALKRLRTCARIVDYRKPFRFTVAAIQFAKAWRRKHPLLFELYFSVDDVERFLSSYDNKLSREWVLHMAAERRRNELKMSPVGVNYA